MINKGIIFDLDGTLWDSSKDVTASWNMALKKLNIMDRITVQDMRSLMGKTFEDIFHIIFPNITKEKLQEIIKECIREEDTYLRKHGGTLYPGLERTLELLSLKYNLYIVSNCQEGYIEAFLEYHKLSKYFLDSENAGRTKMPKGRNIKLVIDRNNLDKAVYIGDTQGDYIAAKFAGIPFIHAKYGFGKVNEETYFINKISELPQLITKLIWSYS